MLPLQLDVFLSFLCLSYVQALSGGQLHHGHFEMMRIGINKRMDESRMFAVWRVPAPWKSKTRKGPGRKMGGGKGSVDHYVTPVKSGRIIFELGGECEFSEVFMMLVSCGFSTYIINRVHTGHGKLQNSKFKCGRPGKSWNQA